VQAILRFEILREPSEGLDKSNTCLRVDRHACLEAAEDVLSRSQALADDTFKALVQGSSASVNLFLNGWRKQDATLCDRAIELSASATNYGILIRRNGILVPTNGH
jgi:hypothetical protein